MLKLVSAQLLEVTTRLSRRSEALSMGSHGIEKVEEADEHVGALTVLAARSLLVVRRGDRTAGDG